MQVIDLIAEINSWERVQAAFKQYWGYEQFRSPQGEIIQSLISGRDALIVMPTGGGKSICFQLPALLQTGLTLVVSPLVALMENQVQELREKSLPAAALHNELPSSQKQQTLRALTQNQLRLLYLSPETLLNPKLWQVLIQPELQINGLILDEAHCLVQWGETFRPAYRRLGAVRSTLLSHKPHNGSLPIAAFTATADPTTQQELRQVLGLQQPQEFLLSPYRRNLHLQVQTIWTPRGRKKKMRQFIQAQGEKSGLIYVRSRRDSENLSQEFGTLGYTTAAYHAGLGANQRRAIEHQWLTGKIQFVVCTCAFGMGINKPDVRWIVHYQAPQLLSEYIQEVGRGGRDGKPATALTLISEPTGWLNPEDKQRQEFFAHQTQKQYQKATQLIQTLPLTGSIGEVTQSDPEAAITLGLLHSLGALTWQNPFTFQRQAKINPAGLQQLRKKQQQIQVEMNHYLATKTCRWQFLLQSFGFTKDSQAMAQKKGCGHCDNCLR